MTYEQLKEIVYANSINDYWAQQTLAAIRKYSDSLTAAKPIVSCECPFCGKAHKKVVSLNETCLDCSEYFNGHRR